MYSLSGALRYEMLFLLAGLVGIVTYRLITRQMNLTGLLYDKASGRAFSPGRLQMLVVTLGVGLYYLLLVFDSKEGGRLPDLPGEFLLALGGSHLFYLGGKLYGLLANRLGFGSPVAAERARLKIERRNKR